jgi:S-DNA-T family DNA segregation ATPase FtsK/SpoIIIE
MTQKDTSSQALQAGDDQGAGRFLRYCLVLLLAGTTLLLWLSMLTFDPLDPPSPSVYAAGRTVENAGGRVGAYLAYQLRYWLGNGVYLGMLLATLAAGLLLAGKTVRDLPWRILGMMILITGASAAIYAMDPVRPDALVEGNAGVLGTFVGDFLLVRLGTAGGWIAIAVLVAIGSLLAADDLVIRLPGLLARALRKGRSASLTVGGAMGAAAGKIQQKRQEAAAQKQDEPARKTQPTPSHRPAQPAMQGHPEGLFSPESPAGQEKKRKKKKRNKDTAKVPKPAPAQGANDSDQEEATPDGYVLPSKDLLVKPEGGYIESQEEIALRNRQVLQQTLDNFNVDARVVGHMTGPCITMFELSLSPGVKVSKISGLSTDLARALAVPGVRIVSPIIGKDTVGIEVPNADREVVRIRQLKDLSNGRDEKMDLPLYLGKDASGDPIIADLAAMPHMLMAGTTGSGKSVCINAIIMSLLLMRKPEEVRFILVDPKMVELAAFESIPHLLCPIINDMRKAEEILEWAAQKMDERYELLKEAGVRNIGGYNRLDEEELYNRLGVEDEEEKKRIPSRLPYYVIIIDELADLMMTSSKEVELHIIRIAQKARAVGIHLVLATQRPSVDVVTGLIKSNMPCRISFRVASRQESRIILDQNGAEVLMGQGDMLFLQPGTSNVLRSQGTFVEDREIRSVVKELKKIGEPQFNAELMRLNSAPAGEVDGERDGLFDKAVEVVLTTQRGSVSLLQRKLQVGYTRASRIVDQMAEAGILGDYKGSQARECLLTLEDWEAMKASREADLSGESSLNGEPTSV